MVDKDRGARSADSMRRRVPESTVKIWVLMDANRWVLTAVLLGAVLVILTVLGRFDASPITEAIEAKDPIETLFQAMVTAIITGVTLVVTLSQLVLSQELGAVGDQRERMSGAIDFRRDVEYHIDESVSPAEPSTFLQALIDAVRTQSASLPEVAASGTNDDLRKDIEEFSREVTTNADRVTDQLETTEFGTFRTLRAALNFNYSDKIYVARRLRAEYEDQLSDAGDAALEEIVTTLELFGPAREHFKTLYFQWELVNLSRAVLYAAIPAFVTAASMILFFDDPGSLPGTTAGLPNVLILTNLAIVVTLAPFMLLVSYILRIATVVKYTLAIGPFILQEDSRRDERD